MRRVGVPASTSRQTSSRILLVSLSLPIQTWSIPGDYHIILPVPGGFRTTGLDCPRSITETAESFRLVHHWSSQSRPREAVLLEQLQRQLATSSTPSTAQIRMTLLSQRTVNR